MGDYIAVRKLGPKLTRFYSAYCLSSSSWPAVRDNATSGLFSAMLERMIEQDERIAALEAMQGEGRHG